MKLAVMVGLACGAEHCQGWYGMNVAPGDVPGILDRLDRSLAAHDRDRSGMTISVGPSLGTANAETLARFQDLGVDRVIVPVAAQTTDDVLQAIDGLAKWAPSSSTHL